jgi:hypothetical protein
MPLVKKVPAASQCKEAFDLILKKMKTSMTPNEKIQAQLHEELYKVLDNIKSKDEEAADAELWTTDSLCYLYYNNF